MVLHNGTNAICLCFTDIPSTISIPVFQTTVEDVDMALINYKSFSVKVKEISECLMECLQWINKGNVCDSFNVEARNDGKLRTCEINRQTKEQFPEAFVFREGYLYYGKVPH